MQELTGTDFDIRRGPAITVDGNALTTAAFESYHGELYSFLRRGTRDPEAAEDLLQDAYLRLAREISAGRAPDNIRAWIYRVAANLVVSRARRRKTVVDWLMRQGRGSIGQEDGPELGALQRERSRELDDALGALPKDARTALLLASEGFSGEEIAEAIGRTPTATRTMMSRARVRVRLDLESRGAGQ
jgi:RNA polymerase sigma factor (sigma-70 family)